MGVMTRDQALRIEQSEIDYLLSHMTFMQAMDGNPFGIDIQHFGGAVVLGDRDASLGPLFNRVLGMNDDGLPHLAAIYDSCMTRWQRCRVDINPYQSTPTLFKALATAGLHPFRFHSFLYALPDDIESAGVNPLNEDVTVKRITAGDVSTWAEVWDDGFTEILGASPDITRKLAIATAQMWDQPGWSLYLASLSGEPAAAAALYVSGGSAGSLFNAGTLPQYRRRGCQTALLKARVSDALTQGCDLIVAQSGLGTTSQNNMERAGLKIAYTRAFWLST